MKHIYRHIFVRLIQEIKNLQLFGGYVKMLYLKAVKDLKNDKEDKIKYQKYQKQKAMDWTISIDQAILVGWTNIVEILDLNRINKMMKLQ